MPSTWRTWNRSSTCIRNPTLRIALPDARHHYPSWGLGTNTRSWRRIDSSVSLPLMGIGNLFRATTPTATPKSAHYPSWGLGTGPVEVGERRTLGLITPHGDWEPHWFCNSPPIRSASLPLMGIGNPHGPYRASARCATSHYPSWGLGTPTSRHRMATTRPAHYPSWGLGTLSPPVPPVRYVHSLPLMGIGNPHPGSDHHLGILLLITPHGDWERAISGSRRMRFELITPHGDWERAFPGIRQRASD